MQPKTKYIILSNYKQKVSCDYIIVKPSTSVLSADESGRVADKCNIMNQLGWRAGYTNSLIKCPLLPFAFLFECFWVENKTMKFKLCFIFHLLKERDPTAIKKQSHNNYSYGVLFGLPVYGLILWKSILVLKIFSFFCEQYNHWNWQKLIWIIYVLSIVLSLFFFFCFFFFVVEVLNMQ